MKEPDRFAVSYDRRRTVIDQPVWPELPEIG
jgi:hypothetical protein